MSANIGASSLSQFSKNLQKFGYRQQQQPQPGWAGLQDYLYRDKAEAMVQQTKTAQKPPVGGFSIDEIMKR